MTKLALKCCYTCLSYEDALCVVSDQHDDEDPNTFKCELYDEDEEETRMFDSVQEGGD